MTTVAVVATSNSSTCLRTRRCRGRSHSCAPTTRVTTTATTDPTATTVSRTHP